MRWVSFEGNGEGDHRAMGGYIQMSRRRLR
jgi:hypothetical protein